MTKRRKFLIGAGALAAGSGAALGTGATSYRINDRTASINVVSDNPSGVIGFADTSPGDIVNETNNRIEIDFAEYGGSDGGSQGINVGSQVLLGGVGNFDPDKNSYVYSPAFQVVNQAAGTTLDYTVSYELTGSLNTDGSYMKIHLTHPGYQDYKYLEIADGKSSTTSDGNPVFEESVNPNRRQYDPLANHAPGDSLNVALYINTDNAGSSIGEDLSGKLTFEAEPV
jgi:hypothetical protein